MEVIAIVNRKGGVGKTTTALALAAGLAKRGKRVLAIDLDSQGNFSQTAQTEIDVVGIYDVLRRKESIMDAIQIRPDSFDLICADAGLSEADITIIELGKELRLKEALEDLKTEYDYVILDTPPAAGILVINALTAADSVIIIAQADTYSAAGLMRVYEVIQLIRKYSNHELTIGGILLTRYSPRTNFSRFVADEFEKLAEKMKTKVFKTMIRENIAIKESQGAKQSIFDYDAHCNGAQDYDSVINELLEG